MTPRSILRSLVRVARRSLQRRPRIVMTLLCRDEEDIVGHNIAYHLAQGVDFIIATDNASTDRTPMLLERFARQGSLHLIHEPRLIHDQAVWVTRMAQMAAKRFDADWVINNDADEFWLSTKSTVRAALAALPHDAECLAVPRFDMAPPRDSRAQFFEAMTLRLTDHKNVHGPILNPKVCHRAYVDVHISDGNHHVTRRSRAMTERSDHSLQILHFPLRSAKQLERKIRQGSEALQANARVGSSIGSHWHRLYRDYLLPGRLDQYYEERVPSAEQAASGLARGTLVEDTRIRDELRRIGYLAHDRPSAASD
ncbi:MAG TPA: glycosyltransferase family 2 protein [Dongiaceae bacterium]